MLLLKQSDFLLPNSGWKTVVDNLICKLFPSALYHSGLHAKCLINYGNMHLKNGNNKNEK